MLSLQVEHYLQFELELAPKKSRGRKGSHKLYITNTGNTATTYTFNGDDPEDMCSFNFKENSVKVEPGAKVEVPVVVDPKKKPFTGNSKTYNFKITVTPHASEAGEGKSVEGQFECTPLIPKWALAIGALALVAIIAIIVVLNGGGSGTKDIVAPAISITPSPASPKDTEQVTFTATASDPSGIQNIEIWVAGVKAKECTSSPCTYTGGPYAMGNVSYEAKAKDTVGNPGTSGSKSLLIGTIDVTGPTVTITPSPANPTTSQPVTFTATASDPSGIQNIEIWVGGAKVKECTSSPCTYTGGPYAVGIVIYEAKAKDTVGNQGTSGSTGLHVISSDRTGPTVNITPSPASPNDAQQVTFTATASDPSGIQNIEIWVGGAQVKECTSSPCTYTGGPYAKGTVVYEAKSKDTLGNPGTSGPKSLLISQHVSVSTGTIDVKSTNPSSGAAISLDGGFPTHSTPWIFTNVSAGQHTIKLVLDHYKYRQENITVTAGQTTDINWSLTYAAETQFVIQPGPGAAKECTVGAAELGDFAKPGELLSGGSSGFLGNVLDRGFLQFDLSSIPATAQVTEASIGLYYWESSPTNGLYLSGDIGAYNVLGNWDQSTITWGNQPAIAGGPESINTVPGYKTNSFLYWTATDLVQGWLNGSIHNYGVVLMDTNEPTYEGIKWFASAGWTAGSAGLTVTSDQYPKLRITYWDPNP
jgi:hypothetical protein